MPTIRDEIDIADDVFEWHQSQGGAAINPMGHALRLLRETVELCVASGAMRMDIFTAVMEEMEKADQKKEFTGTANVDGMLEEYADTRILSSLFRDYFLTRTHASMSLDRKLEVCKLRDWEADRMGVLWRPGRVPYEFRRPEAVGIAQDGKSS